MKFRATWDWHRWVFGVCGNNHDRRRLYLLLLCLEVIIEGRENPAWLARVAEIAKEQEQ